MTPLYRPDIAFGEVLVQHLVNGVDLIPSAKFFGQGLVWHDDASHKKRNIALYSPGLKRM